jgi:hypothetical protein
MAGIVIDNFIDPAGTYATAHTPPAGGLIVPSSGTDAHGAIITPANRMRGNVAAFNFFNYPIPPQTPFYTIEADVYVASNANGVALTARQDPSVAGGSGVVVSYALGGGGRWTLAGPGIVGDTANQVLTVGQLYKAKLALTPALVTFSVDGTVLLQKAVSGTPIIGLCGFGFFGQDTDVTGYQLSDFAAYDTTVPIILAPPPFTSAYGTTYDGKGNVAGSVPVTFRLLHSNATYDLYSRTPFVVTSDSLSGILNVVLLAGADYEMRTAGAASNAWVKFTTGTDTTFHLPNMNTKFT